MMEQLAICGGPQAVTSDQTEATAWPNVGDEEISAIERVLKAPNYGCYDEGYRLEEEFADYTGSSYALAHISGTAAIHAALFAVGIEPGDEVIVPSFTYWASCMPVVALNAVPVFAEVDGHTTNLDPADVERQVTAKTKAIIVVHMFGLPCEMDRIMEVAARHDLKVIEDAAHAHAAEYRGRQAGTIGDVGCFSFQASKLLPAIEGGMVVTDTRAYYERAMALGHYERLSGLPEESDYRQYSVTGLGFKYRIHPASAAMARVRLARLEELNAARNRNMAYLDQALSQIDGFEPIAVPPDSKRVYYGYRLHYHAEALGGKGIDSVVAALRAEGVQVGRERYFIQHLQPVYAEARASLSRLLQEEVAPAATHLPVTEGLHSRLLGLPTFPQGTEALMEQYVGAFIKVSRGWREIPQEVAAREPRSEGQRSAIR